jgi:hypothetical protein
LSGLNEEDHQASPNFKSRGPKTQDMMMRRENLVQKIGFIIQGGNKSETKLLE